MTSVAAPRISAADLPQVLEPIARQTIPGAAHAQIRNWAATESGFSAETYLFDLVGVEGARNDTFGLVFRRPPEYQILPATTCAGST
ncbi:MAG: hypothetical protein ABWY45_22040 [Mycobacterium sp.]